MPDIGSEDLVRLTGKLLHERAVDFRGYKPASLTRRVRRRIDAVKCPDIGSYLLYLDEHPDEYPRLIDSILINVTEFFRDPAAWEVLRSEILPRIMAEKQPGDEVRIWSAGCATGEEPYSLAISLAEMLGPRISEYDVKVYATDIDDDALTTARRAEFSDSAIRGVQKECLEKYFVRNARWAVSREIRRMVVFGRHNLVTDAPIPHTDLIACRNVLIYMSADLQNRVLSRFHYGLEPRGFLFLGKAESLLAASKLFRPVSEKWRLFRKEPDDATRGAA